MTNELEQQFYDTFGIEEKENLNYTEKGFIEHTYNYPDITDRKLLEIICIISQKGGIEIFNRKNIEELKNSILLYCIDRLGYALNKEQYKHQIQQLFKEVSE